MRSIMKEELLKSATGASKILTAPAGDVHKWDHASMTKSAKTKVMKSL